MSKLISPEGPYYSNPDHDNEEAFINEYLNLTASQLVHLAHQPQDMIRKCKMRGDKGGEKCQQLIKGATKIFTPTNGVCYKFNSVHKDTLNESLVVSNTGPDNGLILEIDVEGLNSIFKMLPVFHIMSLP